MENLTSSAHYDRNYFAWQTPIGEFGGWANQSKFTPYILETDDVLDFGCGGGYLIANLRCRSHLGVEVNPAAYAVAKANGIQIYARTEDVPDQSCDIVISNNALEHTLDPLRELQRLRHKIRNGGRLVFVVPCESISNAYRPNDRNHHLYSWSPMCIWNLFSEAGYRVVESKPYIHKWPPGYRAIARLGGRFLFDLACRNYGRIERSWFQVRIIAEKPSI